MLKGRYQWNVICIYSSKVWKRHFWIKIFISCCIAVFDSMDVMCITDYQAPLSVFGYFYTPRHQETWSLLASGILRRRFADENISILIEILPEFIVMIQLTISYHRFGLQHRNKQATNGLLNQWWLTLCVLFFLREQKHIFTYHVIVPLYYDTGSWVEILPQVRQGPTYTT